MGHITREDSVAQWEVKCRQNRAAWAPQLCVWVLVECGGQVSEEWAQNLWVSVRSADGPGPGLTGHHESFRMYLISLHSLFSAAYAYSRSLIHSGSWCVVGTAVLAGSSLKSTASTFTNRCLNAGASPKGGG